MADAPITPVSGASSAPSHDSGAAELDVRPGLANEDGGGVQDASVPARSTKGQFLPGEQWAGNAKGRAKGVKNRITLQRLLVEETLRNKLGIKAEDLLQKAIEMAMGTPAKDGQPGTPGNDKIMRTLLDKLLATPKNSEDGDAKDNAITVNINDLSGSSPRPVATVSRGNQTLSIPRVTSTETGDSDNA
jgi:hypothetical protein